MCGIAGFVGKGERTDATAMIETIRHRGPDDTGVWHQQGVGFSHARLSIIDLSPLGHQPMVSEDGNIVIVFNGEIYNFEELQEELKRKGRRFKSRSDTEVILHLYQEEGTKCFARIDGMFAIAIYDRRTETLVLARDRMGKKPLYWSLSGDTLIFGSELKSLMAHPLWKGNLSHGAMRTYFEREYVPTPSTIFSEVYKLPPATVLSWRKGREPRQEIFWKFPDTERSIGYEEATLGLDLALQKSVESRLVADVPLGIFLSGGLDSSTVAYYAKKVGGEVKTFSIGFEEKSFDESHFATDVARFLGTTHTTERFSSKECVNRVLPLLQKIDEPLADASILPTEMLSEMTRKHVTVALGGDGADELFAGYSTFQAEKFVRVYQMLPSFMKDSIIGPLVRHLPAGGSYMSLDFLANRFIAGADMPQQERHQEWLGAFSRKDPLFSQGVEDDGGTGDSLMNIGGTEKQRLLAMYMRSYLMDQVLVKVDRASMLHGLEVRAPFLDHHLVEFVHRLPYEYKLKNFQGKQILKDLMKDKLPHHIVYRKKKGFGIPIAEWLRGPLKPLMNDLLSLSGLYRTGYFNEDYIERLKSEHQDRKMNHHKRLWTLMVFAIWYDAWHKGTPH